MDELVQWLRAQLEEDERIAQAASPGPWSTKWNAQEYALVAPSRNYPIAEWTYAVATCEPEASTQRAECDTADADFIAQYDPARVLAEIGAKRELLRRYEHLKHDVMPDDLTGVWAFEVVLRAHAVVYAARPGYKESWRP
ncbi:DUF6221 family protein [Streptomyces lusitanus]|uniref:DUF6221 family protein n=1 Tax=Streptomyces lusitanus TaxID=68232 RepID=A0ABU3JP67_9ACTN|nr:DUF6221 family protein [Streptomyces lusitanus]